jgi:hypothetical protein
MVKHWRLRGFFKALPIHPLRPLTSAGTWTGGPHGFSAARAELISCDIYSGNKLYMVVKVVILYIIIIYYIYIYIKSRVWNRLTQNPIIRMLYIYVWIFYMPTQDIEEMQKDGVFQWTYLFGRDLWGCRRWVALPLRNSGLWECQPWISKPLGYLIGVFLMRQWF